MQTWLFGDEITYQIGLTQEEYRSLTKYANTFSFGDSYVASRVQSSFKLDNGCLLVHWDESPGAFMGYKLYEGIKTLFAGDPESVYEIRDQIELEKNVRSYRPMYRDTLSPFQLAIVNGQHTNADAGRTRLSKVYNLDLERLDYSKESLAVIDGSIFANWRRVSSDDVFLAFVSYIGEIIRRDHDLEWREDENERDWPYFLVKKNGKQINVDFIIYFRMFDCDLILESSSAHYAVECKLE